jgi:hypothetical protein
VRKNWPLPLKKSLLWPMNCKAPDPKAQHDHRNNNRVKRWPSDGI